MSVHGARTGGGNATIIQHLPSRHDMVHRATFSVRFRCLDEHPPADFDDDEEEDLPQTRHRHGETFSALIRFIVGPPLDHKRHVTMSSWLIPNIENDAKGYAGMPIEDNSNIIIERGERRRRWRQRAPWRARVLGGSSLEQSRWLGSWS